MGSLLEEHANYFSKLNRFLPKIINHDESESVNSRYKHKPSGDKKRKLKGQKMNNVEYDEVIPAADQEPAEKKVISVENIPSVSMDELKQRLADKLSGKKSDRNYSEDKLKKRKLKRLAKEADKKKKPEFVKSVDLATSLVEDKKPAKKRKLSEAAESKSSIKFSKIETKTDLEVDLSSMKTKKKKKKNLTKMLDDAKEQKKKLTKLEKSDDAQSREIAESKKWKKVMSMAKGEKQTDNPDLIVKKIKREEQKKKKSAKEWSVRKGGEKKLQKQKIKKRQENIDKRISSKKANSKRGGKK